MTDVHILAIDLAKRSFQVCATALGGAVLFNRMASRAKLEAILREQAMYRCDGGLRDEPFLGPICPRSGPQGSPDPSDLREAVRQTAEE